MPQATEELPQEMFNVDDDDRDRYEFDLAVMSIQAVKPLKHLSLSFHSCSETFHGLVKPIQSFSVKMKIHQDPRVSMATCTKAMTTLSLTYRISISIQH